MKRLREIIKSIIAGIVLFCGLFFIFVICNPYAWIGLFIIILSMKILKGD